MLDKVNLAQKFDLFDDRWKPRVVADYNDNKIVLVKVEGEFVWHRHDDTDDLFLVIEGQLTIELRDRDVDLGPGELFVVPRGEEHRPVAMHGVAHALLIERHGTPNTGDAGGMLAAEPVRI